jgi:hypothetical protein
MARSFFGPALGLLLSAQGALGAESDPAAARAQLVQGYALKKKGQCEEAVPYFKESARLDRQPKALLNLADCEEKLRRLSAAQTHFLETRDVARVLGLTPYEKVALERLAALERNIPKLLIRLVRDAPPGTSVTRDGLELSEVSLQTALPIDPGKHTVVARTELLEREYEINLSEGETKELEVTPVGGKVVGGAVAARATSAPAAAKRTESSDPVPLNRGEPAAPTVPLAASGSKRADPSSPVAKSSVFDAPASPDPGKSPTRDDPLSNDRAQQTAGIVVLGVGALGIGLGIFSAAQFAAKNETLSNTCTAARTCNGPAPYERVREEAMTARALSIAGFAGGAVAAGLGLWLVLSAPSSSTMSADRFARPARTRGGSPLLPTGLRSVKWEPLVGGGVAGVVAGGSW